MKDKYKGYACLQGFKELNLIYYFTAGEKEVRCWTIQKGTLAPGAAGVIHSDFERGFIKAEVVAFEDFKAIATGGCGCNCITLASGAMHLTVGHTCISSVCVSVCVGQGLHEYAPSPVRGCTACNRARV